MNPTRTLKRIRNVERSIGRIEVLAVLTRSRRCFAQENGRWRLEGLDMSGDPLVVIVEIQAGVVVVTVYRGDEDEG
jgi:hypothetical protein